MTRPSLVQIGVITAAHGIKGYVKIRSYANPPKAIFDYGVLHDKSGGKNFSLTSKGGADESLIASVEGVKDRNEAELLRGTVLYADAEAMPEDATDKLVGALAILPGGTAYGTIISIQNFGAGDIAEIKKIDGSVEMLPLDERFVTVKDDKIIVTPPDYVEASDER